MGMLCAAFGLSVYEGRAISNLALVPVGLVASDYLKLLSVRVNTISYDDFNHELFQLSPSICRSGPPFFLLRQS